MSETEQQLFDRKLIYQARRGLKELDYFIDPTAGYALTAS